MSREESFPFRRLPPELGAHVLRFLGDTRQNARMAPVARDFSNLFTPHNLGEPPEFSVVMPRYRVFDFTALYSGFEHRAAWLAKIQEYARDQELRVVRIADVGAEDKELLTALGTLTQLREVCVWRAPAVDCKFLTPLLQANPCLERLVLRDVSVNNDVIRVLPPALKHLDLSDCLGCNDDALRLLAQCIGERGLPLRELVVGSKQMSERVLQDFCDAHLSVHVEHAALELDSVRVDVPSR